LKGEANALPSFQVEGPKKIVWIYVDRVAGGYRDYRDPDRLALARSAKGPGSRGSISLSGQSQTVGDCRS
jgi:hypothetical protein